MLFSLSAQPKHPPTSEGSRKRVRKKETSGLAGESTSQHMRERGMCSAHRVVQTVVLHEACAFDIVSQVTADRDVTGTFVQVVSPTA